MGFVKQKWIPPKKYILKIKLDKNAFTARAGAVISPTAHCPSPLIRCPQPLISSLDRALLATQKRPPAHPHTLQGTCTECTYLQKKRERGCALEERMGGQVHGNKMYLMGKILTWQGKYRIVLASDLFHEFTHFQPDEILLFSMIRSIRKIYFSCIDLYMNSFPEQYPQKNIFLLQTISLSSSAQPGLR